MAPNRATLGSQGLNHRFRRFAWGLLAYNILVVLWGAYVRASKSGDGCGSHWPTCNGSLIPGDSPLKTWIEYSHRISSGAVLLLVIGLVVWSRFAFPKGHPTRLGAWGCFAFTFSEALIGAGLVLFKWVAGDTSSYRVVALSAHLVNTLFLLAFLTLTAWWASGGQPIRLKGQGRVSGLLAGGLLATIALAVTGAISALGDTLYPARSLIEGMRQDFAPDAVFLLRHRPLHPFTAIAVTVTIWLIANMVTRLRPTPLVQASARRASVAFGLQLLLGLINLGLLAPIWMQLIHLMVADLVWISLILLCATALAVDVPHAEQTADARSDASDLPAEEVRSWPINSPSAP